MALNILVVDDSAVTRAMIIKTLKLAEIPLGEIYQASNGQEGLDALAKSQVDMVFTDINMPVMDGEEMVKRLRQSPDWSDMPLVVVSTEGSQTRIERLEQQGAWFVHKPFTPECVREVVKEMTGVTS
jgi:two-component system chemotaxis response regulator CheY